MEIIGSGENAVVEVGYRCGHDVAVHDGIGMCHYAVAVEEVSVHSACTACGMGFILPPILDTCMIYVVEVHNRLIGAGSSGGVELGVVIAADVLGRTDGNTMVGGAVPDPIAAKVGDIEADGSRTGALNAFDNVQIVFITGYSDYIAEGYEVAALHYLMKPVDFAILFFVLFIPV